LATPFYFLIAPRTRLNLIQNGACMINNVKKFLAAEDGAALAEYGVLVAFIAIVAITAVTFFGSKVSAKFSQLGNSFT